MLIDKIREATAGNHKQTDAFIYPFFDAIKTTEDYTRILKAFYGFFQPVMAKIDQQVNKELVADYAERRKISALGHDLEQSGIHTKDIQPAADMPVITNEAQAMGAYYVLEGSTLGGVFLSGIIAERLNAPDRNGISFFSGYGGNSKSMWNRFLTYIEHYSNNEQQSAGIVHTAEQTFRLFYEHLQKILK